MSTKATPPPRKVKYLHHLKGVHSEQLSKLQLKHQQDTELLDDIRNFTKIRAQIEKDYGGAMVKLATTYLAKKPPPGVDYRSENKAEIKSVFGVWRMLLDESEKIGKARLASADIFQSRIYENAKNTRQAKLTVAKKCFDALRKYQDEVQQAVLEIDKTRKLYFEEEHMAHDARGKVQDVEEKLKKKKGGIFSSISSLQKKNDKFSSRREACDIQSTKARNDYILALAGANAHQKRYYEVDLRVILESLDCDISQKVRDYLVLMSRTELLTVAACSSSFSRIQEEASKITKQYSVDQYLLDNPALGQTIEYEFEACDGDEIRTICTDHLAEHALQKDAKRWASAYMKECRVLRDSNRELNKLLSRRDKGEKTVENVSGESEEIESKIEEYKNIIRRAETGLVKAEARLAALRAGGVNVDDFLSTLDIDSFQLEELTRKESSASRRSFDVSRDSDDRPVSQSSSGAADDMPHAVRTDSNQTDVYDERGGGATGSLGDSDANRHSEQSYEDYQNREYGQDEGDYPDHQQEYTTTVSDETAVRQQQQDYLEAAAWGDDDANSAYPEDGGQSAAGAYSSGEWESAGDASAAAAAADENSDWSAAAGQLTAGCRCMAIYSYEAANDDELSFVEGEQLDCVHEGDGDGWVRARNSQGIEGYIPANYVQLIDEHQGFVSDGTEGDVPLASADTATTFGDDSSGGGHPSDSNQAAAAMAAPPTSLPIPACGGGSQNLCRALYDYESNCEDELSFPEGAVIRVVSKLSSEGVDDGWWIGEYDGKTGAFPSLVVEEIKDSGEPQTPLTPMVVPTPDGLPPPPDFEPPPPVGPPPVGPPPVVPPPTAATPAGDGVGDNDTISAFNAAPPPTLPPLPPPPPPPPDVSEDDVASQIANREGVAAPAPPPPPPSVAMNVTDDAPTSNVNIVIDSPDEPPREFFDSFDEDEPPTTIERKPSKVATSDTVKKDCEESTENFEGGAGEPTNASAETNAQTCSNTASVTTTAGNDEEPARETADSIKPHIDKGSESVVKDIPDNREEQFPPPISPDDSGEENNQVQPMEIGDDNEDASSSSDHQPPPPPPPPPLPPPPPPPSLVKNDDMDLC